MYRARAHADRGASRWRGVWRRAPHFRGRRCGPGACVRGGCAAAGEGHTTRGCRGPATHANEREGAARVDWDKLGVAESRVGADVVVLEATVLAAGERGGRPGGDVDTADAVVATVLQCIGREHTLSEEQARGVACGGEHHTSEGGGAGLPVGRVCDAGAPLRGEATSRGVQGGQASTATSAKAPFGAIATPRV